MKKYTLRAIHSLSIILLCCIYTQTASARAEQHTYKPEDFSHWLNAALIAQATYQSNENMTEVLASQGYTMNRFKQIKGFSVAYVLATNDTTKQHILAIRGTANLNNAFADAAFVLVPDALSGIDIHQGFLLTARDIYQEINSELKPGYQVNTIGHSLGGAAAIILAMMLDAQQFSIGEVITFGQPKVTNISGSQKFKHLKVTRLVTPKDIVPLMPPFDPVDLMNLSIFWHQGTEIILYNNHRYSVLSGIASMMRATDFLNDIPNEQHLTHHFMTSYITHLKNKLEIAEEVKYKSDFRFSDWFGSSADTANP